MKRKIRSTFKPKTNSVQQHSFIARREIKKSNDRNDYLYNPDRPRSMSELETMKAAAQRNPGGRAAEMLRAWGDDGLKRQTKRAKKAS